MTSHPHPVVGWFSAATNHNPSQFSRTHASYFSVEDGNSAASTQQRILSHLHKSGGPNRFFHLNLEGTICSMSPVERGAQTAKTRAINASYNPHTPSLLIAADISCYSCYSATLASILDHDHQPILSEWALTVSAPQHDGTHPPIHQVTARRSNFEWTKQITRNKIPGKMGA